MLRPYTSGGTRFAQLSGSVGAPKCMSEWRQMSDRLDELTPRERETFELLRLGLTNEEIA